MAITDAPMEIASWRRWAALAVVSAAVLMNSLDQTIVNVALPRIQHDLHMTTSSLAWVIDAYLIVFAGTLLLAGRLGDIYGRKRIFMLGVALFTVSSACCGFSPTAQFLFLSRAAQGLGAALSTSVVIAIIVAEFPDAHDRTRAMSQYVLVAVGGGTFGLLVGGAITQALGWHWNFFINVPVGIVALILAQRWVLPHSGTGTGSGLDVAGALLSTGGLISVVYTIVSSSQAGWASEHTYFFGGIAVLLLGLFVFWERRAVNPLMPFSILRSPGLLTTALARGLTVVGLFATFFNGALYLEKVLQYRSLITGFSFLPMTLAVLCLSLGPTAALIRRYGPKSMVTLGLFLTLGGLCLFLLTGIHTDYLPTLFFAILLVGVGCGLLFTPLITIAVAKVPSADAGLASGIVNVSQQMSGATAVAVLASLAADRTASAKRSGTGPLSALEAGYHLGFEIAVVCVALALIVTVLWIEDVKTEIEVPEGAVVAFEI